METKLTCHQKDSLKDYEKFLSGAYMEQFEFETLLDGFNVDTNCTATLKQLNDFRIIVELSEFNNAENLETINNLIIRAINDGDCNTII